MEASRQSVDDFPASAQSRNMPRIGNEPQSSESVSARRTGALPSLESPRRNVAPSTVEPLPSLGLRRGNSPSAGNNPSGAAKPSLSPLGVERPQVDPQALAALDLGPRHAAAFPGRRRAAPAGGIGTRLAPLEAGPCHNQDNLPFAVGVNVPTMPELRPSCPWEVQDDGTRFSDIPSDSHLSARESHDEGTDAEGVFISALASSPVYLVQSPEEEDNLQGSLHMDDMEGASAVDIHVSGDTPEERRASSSASLGARARAEVERAVHDAFLEECGRGSSPTAAAAEAIRRCRSSVSRESVQNEAGDDGGRSEQAVSHTPFFNESHRLLLKEGKDPFGVTA